MTTMDRALTARELADRIRETHDSHTVMQLSAQLEKLAREAVQEARQANAGEGRTAHTAN